MLPFDYRSGRAMANRNDLMEQRVVALEQKVGGFGERFDAIDVRFDAMDKRLDAVDVRFDAVDRRFDAVDKRFDAMDARLDGMDRKFDELPTKSDLKVFMEEMASQVKTAVEGYGATLDSIDRRLRRMSTQIRTKDRDRDLVLKDHGKRIRALERR